MTPRRRKAFTLIEVLLALAVGSMLLVAASAMAVDLTRIWWQSGRADYYVEHIDGVESFLRHLIDQAETGGPEGRRLPVEWRRPPATSDLQEPFLSLALAESPPALLAETESPPPGVSLYLHFDRNSGLSLVWHSRLQLVEDEDDLYTTPVSSFVREVEYAYYDRENERWETDTQPQKEGPEEYVLPDFLLLHLTPGNDGEEKTIRLLIPSAGRTPAPAY